jgi:toluene monooxygenase system protein E
VNRPVPPLRTYSHLAAERRVPSEYDVVTSRMLYHPQRGFEVEVPLAAWYQRHQKGSLLACADWERFRDPRETTYPAYTALQSRQEVHLQGVARSWDATEHDPAVAAGWAQAFARVLAPLRFPLHGFQMIAAYAGQMAPSGRITIACAFQAADEMRRVHWLARRMGHLRRSDPSLPAESRKHWQEGAAWQPLRRAVELALVAFDWGEALVALNLCLKPLLEGLFLTELGRQARQGQDFLLAQMLDSFDEDGRWHRDWSAALVRLAQAERPENCAAIAGWVDRWYPLGRAALEAAAPLLGPGAEQAAARAEGAARQWLASLALERS